MAKIITYEYVKEEFRIEGYVLLSKEYIEAHSKLDYVCPKGHYHNISWVNWQQGQRCSYCSARPPITIEFVRKKFEEEGYKLLSDKYINAHQKLKYVCPKGHKHSIPWSAWQQGKRCLHCANIKNGVRVSGPGHHMWKGGVSCEPYCDIWLDKDFKKSIKDRDGNMCLNPDCFGSIYKLCVHHIDYNKKNCKPTNLITLCASCNARANKNREWHEAWYQAIMYMRGYI